jgi:putative CocE/NonD family hydrolase
MGRAAALLFLCLSPQAVTLHAQTRSVFRIPMRDGVRLSTNVFMPIPSGKHQALLVRTPYGKGTALLPGYKLFTDNGFVVVVQDVRGRYASEGVFRPPVQEDNDGNDTINWIARQPWSDGAVGMLGGSYVGIAQWKAALTRNPHLRAIFPIVAGSDEYLDRFYSPGGALKLGHRMQWIAENVALPFHPRPPFDQFIFHRPLRTMDRLVTGQSVGFFQESLNHPTYDAYWRSRSTRERLQDTNVPAFIVGGWYDNYVESDIATFTELRRYNMSEEFSGVSFGRDARVNLRPLQLSWFSHWMRGPQPVPDFSHAPVRIFVMGANRWRDEQEWPIARTKYTPLYLAAGRILSIEPRAAGKDEFVYDPENPAPTRGGAICCNSKVFPPGPMDQRDVEARPDVLVYSTGALKEDVEVTGEVNVILHVSTSARDTDFTAKLVDVFPNGHARNLCDGILRLRYRNGLRKAELAKPGEVYTVRIKAGVTSNVFKAGHRIRIEISSSNFPRFDRNPNTGRSIADEQEQYAARQTVFYGSRQASHVLLPIVPQKEPAVVSGGLQRKDQ